MADAGLEEAIILCGGFGTRLRAVVADRPKALVTVAGRPFLEWLILSLRQRHGIQRVILATGHLGAQIEAHFGPAGWCGVAIEYSRDDKPLGTGGAFRMAVGRIESPRVLVLNGDTYCRYNTSRMMEVHLRHGAVATLWLERAGDGGTYDKVSVDETGRVRSFDRESSAGRYLASAGVYLIERRLVATVPANLPVSLEREVFPSLVGNGLYAVAGGGTFIDLGTPESLRMASEMLGAELSDLACE
jgi:NDP-sugar pyrophosphorylase family protein